VRRAVVIVALAWRAAARADEDRPVSTPLVVAAGGVDRRGAGASLDAGWGWGSHDGGVVAVTVIQRVLASVRQGARTSVALTWGLYGTAELSAGIDAGVMADGDGAGPIVRATIGVRGAGLRFTGGAAFDRAATARGVAELALVVDVMDVAGRL
jgi:hypothetical protein